MNSQAFLHMTKEAIWLTILLSAPAIGVSVVVGLIVAIFSATTQIQEQALSFAPKMIAVYIAVVISAVLLGGQLLTFTSHCFSDFAFGR
jgi:flagellar biosynthetic protein FliQ